MKSANGMRAFISIVLLAAANGAFAQTALSGADARPGITGFWSLRFDSRNVPKAALVPGVGARAIAQREAGDRHAIRWCQPVGMPALMDSSAPIGIVQNENEVAISTEAPAAPRHIYLNRAPPDANVFENTTNGFSIGHWDGDVLVVETAGFNDKGETLIPGGGYRTPTAKLTERFQVRQNGYELRVTSSWTDPKVYAKPHAYSYRYFRVPDSFNFGEFFCDSHDDDRTKFLETAPDSGSDAQGGP